MAEAALYNIHDEPPFPYDKVADTLTWVAEYIASLTPRRTRTYPDIELYALFINTLLVFARARTSAFHDLLYLPQVTTFIVRLNDLARDLGEHRQCLTTRIRAGNFFIVNENNR